VRKSQDGALPHLSLGAAYGKQNRLDEAVNEFNTALKLKPDYGEAILNLQMCYVTKSMKRKIEGKL